MPTATSFVATDRGPRYVKQLVSHFGTKITTRSTETGGVLEFAMGSCELRSSATGIELEVTSSNQADLASLTDVVASHLVRFGSADELSVDWT